MSGIDRTLWVGNLNENITEELLYELFLQAGPLEKVAIAKEKDGRPKKFAFVTFQHDCSVPYTIKLMDGVSLHGHTLKLQTRPGSCHQQVQLSPMGNNYSNNRPQQYRNGSPQANFQGNQHSGGVMALPPNPFSNNIPQRGGLVGVPPVLQKSNTWHGNDLTQELIGQAHTSREHVRDNSRDRDYHRDRSSDRDRDRSGDRHDNRDRDRRGREEYGRQGHSSHHGQQGSQEAQRERMLNAQAMTLEMYRQTQSSRQHRPPQHHRF